MSSSTANRKENERTKLIQEKCLTLLTQMLRDEDNKYCVDCDAKGPRWASWNLGVFLCIRCAGIHRNLGVHISRVKSVNLDTWTPEQVISLQQMGNSRARAVYEAQLPDGFRRPQTDTALESFIRAKYEHKKYLAREWVQPSPPKVDWAKEIDEELERQKRKKKAAQANTSLGIGVLNTDKKPTSMNSGKSAPLPAPLPKPKSSGNDASPKTHRIIAAPPNSNNISNDLLGLASPTKPVQCNANTTGTNNDALNDSFSNFLSATPTIGNSGVSGNGSGSGNGDNNYDTNNAMGGSGGSGNNSLQNSLAKDEEDFFNQGTLGTNDKDKSGKLTKDSILALYGTAAANPTPFAQTAPNPMFGGGFMNPAAGYAMMQHPQQAQFMTPPNSTSMYNSPVMTAPNAFNTTCGGGGSGGGNGGLGGGGVGVGVMPFATQFTSAGVPNAFAAQQMMMPNAVNAAAVNAVGMQQGLPNANFNMGSQQPMNYMLGGMNMAATTQSNPAHLGHPAAAANLNQQFGNLNIGNVWQ